MISAPSSLPLDQATYQQMSRLYLIALSAIAGTILVSQVLIQRHLDNQLSDSRVINVAGRQRMLSQRLSKEVLLLEQAGKHFQSQQHAIKEVLLLWMTSHEGLQTGNDQMGLPARANSPEIEEMFAQITPYYEQMVRGTQVILRQPHEQSSVVGDSIQWGRTVILENEPSFLRLMNQIVFQYDYEAQNKVNALKRKEYFLLLISLGILLLEVLWIFRPLMKRVRLAFQSIMRSEQEAKRQAEENEVLYQEKNASLQELQALTYAVDKAALFASISLDGTLAYCSDRFRKTLLLNQDDATGYLPELITADEREQQNLEHIIQQARTEVWQGEICITQPSGEYKWLDVAVVPVSRIGAQQQLWMCYDSTVRKEAQLTLERLSAERFQAEMQAQKLRSAQVLKAQEEERKRIAKEIHDGIGQMLTAIKFQLQSIDPQDAEGTEEKQSVLQDLVMRLIKGTRIVTFNLTPPELGDYGLASALGKMASELSKLTGKHILFQNRTQFDQRFEALVETNLFRIAQEAVNNAIKYADSSYILMSISHSDTLFSVVIDDDGNGFEKADPKRNGDAGMGMAFMEERTQYVGGRLFVSSVPGEGTRITINMPI